MSSVGKRRGSVLLNKFFLFLFILLPIISRNFEKEKRKIRDKATWEVGSFYFRPLLYLRNIGYDYNIYTSLKQNEGDWFIYGGGGFGASVIRPVIFASFELTPTVLAFLHHPSENFFSLDHKGELAARISKLHLFLDYTKYRRKQRPAYEMAPRIITSYRGLTFSAELSPDYPLSLGFSVRRENFSYERPESFTGYFSPDRMETSYEFSVKKRLFTVTHLYFYLGLKKVNFRLNPRERDAIHRWLSIGLQLPPIGKLRGSASIGYKEILPIKQGIFQFRGMVGKGSLLLDLLPFFISLTYTLDWNYSPYLGEIERVEFLRTGGGLRLFRGKMKIRSRWGWGRLTFPFIDRTDRIESYEGDLLFRAGENTYAGIGYYWRRTRSNSRFWNGTFKTIGGIIEYGF